MSADNRRQCGSFTAAAAQPTVHGPAPSPTDEAVLDGPPQRVGRFEYHYGTDTWIWSDAVARMHGYRPSEVTPTTELVLSHKHPDDLARVRALLTPTSAPFSSRHRIRTATGEIRRVVVVGDAVTDHHGRITATRGFYIDVTEGFADDLELSLNEKLDEIVAHRETIDLAKGMLMAIYRITPDAAFDVLKWRSQELNVKLFTVAERLVAELPGLIGLPAATSTTVHRYLMTMTFDD
ncbi:PAS and ANTAR domain-containing protein [Mycobacterium sp. SA01]|uniref:PAS and ANTAR domain-containing protein n=1 Tax=Mycobacterium sp. SA01 TaxID=3238820 RepID=UPI00351B1F19